ncbi:hypothetical protein K2X05_02835 [bacterium]|nr:hypothetical protein [bacterium]
MTQIIKNITTFVAFAAVIFMHIYFVLILMAKPALAEEKEEKTVTIEKEEAKSYQFDINGTKGTVKVNKNGITISSDDEEGEEVTAKAVGARGNLRIDTNPMMAAGVSKMVSDAMVVPVVLFLCVFGFAAFTVYSKSRTRREYLETIKALAQSGQPIPQELMNSMNATVNGGKSLAPDRMKYDANAVQGIKYIFWGIGFCGFMMLISEGHVAYAIGFLFIVMGAFHIYTSQMIQKQKNTDTVASTSTPETK